MWGIYDNFPTEVHRTIFCEVPKSNIRVQESLLQLFQALNQETFRLKDVAYPSISRCTVIFDFGIAKATNFYYLSREETEKFLKVARKRKFPVIDFFCVVRYYRKEKNLRTPLNFDYYILRFRFDKGPMVIQVFHEKGPRHVSPQEIIKFFINQINKTLTDESLTLSLTS